MILVFKTSVKDGNDISKLSPFLDKLLSASKWNFDLADCDNILRINTEKEVSVVIVKLLQNKGFSCEELPD